MADHSAANHKCGTSVNVPSFTQKSVNLFRGIRNDV